MMLAVCLYANNWHSGVERTNTLLLMANIAHVMAIDNVLVL